MPSPADPAAPRLTPARLAVLGAVTALGPLSIDLYLPAFPEVAAELGTSESAVQLTLTACVVGLAVGQLVAGPLSDRFGRRRPIAVGLAAWVLAALACAVAPSIELLVLLRLLQGLAGAVGLVVARAVLRDTTEGPRLTRAFARLMLVVGVVPILAPTAGGGLLQLTDWRGCFVVLAAVGTVVGLLALRTVPETLPPQRRRSARVRDVAAGYALLLTDAGFLRPALVAGLAFAALFTYVSASPFVFREVHGLSTTEYGLAFGINSVALVGGGQAVAALSDRLPLRLVQRVALACGCLAGAGMVVAAATGAFGYAGLAVPLFLVVLAVGAAMPVAAGEAMTAHPDRAGAASGLLGVVQFGLGGLAGPVVGTLGAGSAVPMGAAMTAFLAGALVLALRTPAPAAAPAPAGPRAQPVRRGAAGGRAEGSADAGGRAAT